MEIVLKNAKTDTATCFHFLRWVSDLSTAEHETAVRVSKWTIKAAKKNGDKKCLAQAWYALGRSYQVIDDFKTAIIYFKKASQLADKYDFYGLQGKLFSCFANTYSAVKQYKLAREYYYKAIHILKEHALTNDLPGIYFNLASLEYEAKPDSNYVKNALKNVHDALETAKPEVNYDVITYALWIKALIYHEELKNDSSLIFIDQAFSVARQYNFTDFYQPYYSFKALVLKNKGNYNEAMNVLEQGLKEAERAKSQLWMYNFLGEMANVAASKGDFKSAFEFHIKHKMYYDSVVNTENFAKLNDLEAELKLEKKEKEKQITSLLLQQSEQNGKNLKIMIFSVCAVVVILTMLVFVLIRNARVRKEAYLKLQQKNIEIQQQSEQLAKLSNEITKYQTQMNPHFVFNALNSIQGFVVNNEKEKTLQQLGNFSKLMRTTLNNSNHELISLNNEIDYLKTYIAFEQERFKNKINFKINLNVDDNETMVPPMMIQPLLENALKHARLGDVDEATILLNISNQGGTLKISVIDNGKGIQGDKNELIKHSHSMSIIKSRIKLAFDSEKIPLPRNYFSITTVPETEKGTRIEFCLPVVEKF